MISLAASPAACPQSTTLVISLTSKPLHDKFSLRTLTMSIFAARRSNRPAWTVFFLSQAGAVVETLSGALLGELLAASRLMNWTNRELRDEIVREYKENRSDIMLTLGNARKYLVDLAFVGI